MKYLILYLCLWIVKPNDNWKLQDCEQGDQDLSCNKLMQENFIRSYLRTIPLNEKLKQMNSLIPRYSRKKIHFEKTPNGLGVFLDEDIQSRDKIFTYDPKKIISSRQINQGIFFQNSLYRFHQKIKISKRVLSEFLPDFNYIQTYLSIINLYYHFSRIDDSFLKEDLIGFPFKKSLPVLKITPYEQTLFKHNLDNFYKNYENVINEYEVLMQILELVLGQEKFNFYFKRQVITLSEYIYLQSIRLSRQHYFAYDCFVVNTIKFYFSKFPIYHYVNHIDHIDKGDYQTAVVNHSNQLEIYSTSNKQNQDNEFLINYGYNNYSIYVFILGFMPIIRNLQCVKFQILEIETAQIFQIDHFSCINSKTLNRYSLILLDLIDSQLLQNCYLRSTPTFKQLFQSTPSLEKQSLLLWSQCHEQNKYSSKQPFNLFRDLDQKIQNEKLKYEQYINEIQSYLNLRIENQRDSEIAKLLLEFQKNYLEMILQSEKNLNMFLIQNKIIQ